MLSGHPLHGALVAHRVSNVVPPHVAAGHHRDRVGCATNDDLVRHVITCSRGELQAFVAGGFERNKFLASKATVSGYYNFWS